MPADERPTIYALSSGRPPAAVAIIRTSGPKAHEAAGMLTRLPPPRRATLRTLCDPRDGRVIDRALVLRFDAPQSATGEDVVEYQCHGGRAVVDAVLAALGAIDGLREAEPGEFTRRAFANGRIDLTEAEGLADLLEAETEAQRRTALATASGGLKRQIEVWAARLVELSARAEAAIDYVDEDEVAGVDERLSGDSGAQADELAEWLARPRIEPLRDGVRVVVAGPTNSGKSSLINAISESERAIVTEIPGTTRDTIEVPLAMGGIPLVLVDTAGLRDTDDRVELIGIDRALGEQASADILLWLGEACEAPDHRKVIAVHSKGRTQRAGVAGPNGRGFRGYSEACCPVTRTSAVWTLLRRRFLHLTRQATPPYGVAAVFDGSETHDVVLAASISAARARFGPLPAAGVEDISMTCRTILHGKMFHGKRSYLTKEPPATIRQTCTRLVPAAVMPVAKPHGCCAARRRCAWRASAQDVGQMSEPFDRGCRQGPPCARLDASTDDGGARRRSAIHGGCSTGEGSASRPAFQPTAHVPACDQ